MSPSTGPGSCLACAEGADRLPREPGGLAISHSSHCTRIPPPPRSPGPPSTSLTACLDLGLWLWPLAGQTALRVSLAPSHRTAGPGLGQGQPPPRWASLSWGGVGQPAGDSAPQERTVACCPFLPLCLVIAAAPAEGGGAGIGSEGSSSELQADSPVVGAPSPSLISSCLEQPTPHCRPCPWRWEESWPCPGHRCESADLRAGQGRDL